jgi:hypothetical protein
MWIQKNGIIMSKLKIKIFPLQMRCVKIKYIETLPTKETLILK